MSMQDYKNILNVLDPFGQQDSPEVLRAAAQIIGSQNEMSGKIGSASLAADAHMRAAEESARAQEESAASHANAYTGAADINARALRDIHWPTTEAGARFTAQHDLAKIAAQPQNKLFEKMAADETKKGNQSAYMTGIMNLGDIGQVDKATGNFAYAHPEYEKVVNKYMPQANGDPQKALQLATSELANTKLKVKYSNPNILNNLYRDIHAVTGEQLNVQQLAGIIQGIRTGNPDVLKRVDSVYQKLGSKSQEADLRSMAQQQEERQRLQMGYGRENFDPYAGHNFDPYAGH